HTMCTLRGGGGGQRRHRVGRVALEQQRLVDGDREADVAAACLGQGRLQRGGDPMLEQLLRRGGRRCDQGGVRDDGHQAGGGEQVDALLRRGVVTAQRLERGLPDRVGVRLDDQVAPSRSSGRSVQYSTIAPVLWIDDVDNT